MEQLRWLPASTNLEGVVSISPDPLVATSSTSPLVACTSTKEKSHKQSLVHTSILQGCTIWDSRFPKLLIVKAALQDNKEKHKSVAVKPVIRFVQALSASMRFTSVFRLLDFVMSREYLQKVEETTDAHGHRQTHTNLQIQMQCSKCAHGACA